MTAVREKEQYCASTGAEVVIRERKGILRVRAYSTKNIGNDRGGTDRERETAKNTESKHCLATQGTVTNFAILQSRVVEVGTDRTGDLSVFFEVEVVVDLHD
jgi:hypothetical protein